MTSAPVLQLDDIHTYYGESHVLQGVSLVIGDGELVCLLGRNGAGKTTTINSIIGFNRPREGRVLLRGVDITRQRPFRIAANGVGLVPQGRRIFRDLTVIENLTMAASDRRGPWDVRKIFKVFPRLLERQFNMGDQLSGGEQQMLAIGRALLMNPGLILMDEPSEGLAPLVVADIANVLREIKQNGISILLVEQNLPFALALANRCYVLSKGRIVHESDPLSLRLDRETTRQYLGV